MDSKDVPYGSVEGSKILRQAWGTHPPRPIGEVREGDLEKSCQFFMDRFQALQDKVDAVIQKVESAENKGSYLMKIIHLKEQLPDYDGLGDYLALEESLTKYETQVKEIIQKNRARNSEIKTALIEEAKQLGEVFNWKDATEMAQDIKTRWIKTGSAEQDKNEALENAFWEIISAFFERKKQFYEDKQKLVAHRKRQYEALVEEAEKANSLHGKDRFDKVKALKAKWKEAEGIPAEMYQPLLEAFHQRLKKGKQAPPEPKKSYTTVLDRLQQIKSDASKYQKEEMDRLKKELMRDRSRNPQKWEALGLIQLLNERDFVLKISHKRFTDFAKMAPQKKLEIKKNILRDLIQRDEEDLKVYEENAAHFVSADGSSTNLVDQKLKSQKKKIQVKNELLGWLDMGDF